MNNITNIPSARSDFLDPRAPGKVSREWYQFLLNLFTLLGAGSNTASISDLLVAPEVQAMIAVDQIDMMPFPRSTVILADDVTGILPPRHGGAILYSYYNLGGF